MTELTQQQIDALIQEINEAEDPESVTNGMVATVLDYLNERHKAGRLSLGELVDTISAIQTSINSLQTGLSGVSGNFESIDDRKTDKNIQTGRLTYPQAPVVVLASMGQELDSVGKSSPVAHVASAGDYIWDANNGIQYYKSIDDVKQIGLPQRGIVYTNAHSNRQYRWNGTTWLQVGGNDNDGTINQSVYQNMERLNDRLNALIRALANIAFTGQKPDEMELDWDGTKYIVSLDMTGLDGTEVQETYPKQVIEGNAATITIVPSNSEHILRNASYKERSNDQPTNATIADNKAVITIRNVRSDKTIYVLATASAKQQFTAAISDQRVSGTGSTSGIVEGSAWATVLSINDGEAEGTSILGVSAEMEGGGHIAVHNNTVSTDCVTGNITITVTVAVVEQMSVVLVGDDDLASVDVSKVGEGAALEAVVSPKTFCKFTGAPTVEMGGEPVLNAVTDNGDDTYTVSIAEVTGDVEISVAAVDNNVGFRAVRLYRDISAGSKQYFAVYPCSTGSDSAHSAVSEAVDLGENRNSDVVVTYGDGAASNGYKAVLFLLNALGKIVDSYSYANSNTQGSVTVSPDSGVRYALLSFRDSKASSAFIAVDGNECFRGSSEIVSAFKTIYPFANNAYFPTWLPDKNENGDYINAILCGGGAQSYANGDTIKVGADAATKGIMQCFGNLVVPYGVSKITLDSAKTIKWSAGIQSTGWSSSNAPCIAYKNDSNKDYFLAWSLVNIIGGTTPKTLPANTEIYLCFDKEHYDDAFIKNNADDTEVLWNSTINLS